MIHIVGGFYEEFCLYPQWHRYFGSAGRAAAALSEINHDIIFHTYVHNDHKVHIEYLSQIYNVKIDPHLSTEKIGFEYYHSLSTPTLYTTHTPITQHEPMHISGDIVIYYGMLEAANPIIEADYVIFDPQSENDPSMIFDNGSKINHLAILLNVEEGEKFTNEKSINAIAKHLFARSPELKVVILKDGPFGAHIFFDGEHHHIGSYETKNVFKIGSGDVFVAIFAHMWAHQKKSPLEAAEMASLATAYYCNYKILPIPQEAFDHTNFPLITIDKEISSKRIYLAGPFFTMSERWLIEEAKYQLEKFKANVFSPLHDVGYGEPSYVTEADLQGIDDSDILYAVLDDYDPGTIFEIGYAISKQKPVVIFIENKVPINMTLFEGSGCIIEHDFATSIYRTIWEVAKK